jgi:hypothetical protein
MSYNVVKKRWCYSFTKDIQISELRQVFVVESEAELATIVQNWHQIDATCSQQPNMGRIGKTNFAVDMSEC